MAKKQTSDEMVIEGKDVKGLNELLSVKTTTPTELAEELEISPKNLRAWLRENFPRPKDEKNTSWKLSEAQVTAAREHFEESDEDEESDEEDDEV